MYKIQTMFYLFMFCVMHFPTCLTLRYEIEILSETLIVFGFVFLSIKLRNENPFFIIK